MVCSQFTVLIKLLLKITTSWYCKIVSIHKSNEFWICRILNSCEKMLIN